MKPNSVIHFKVFDHSTFRKDTLLGERYVYLATILRQYSGKCDNLELTMELVATKPNSRQSRTGELVAMLDGLNIDVNLIPVTSGPEQLMVFRLERGD